MKNLITFCILIIFLNKSYGLRFGSCPTSPVIGDFKSQSVLLSYIKKFILIFILYKIKFSMLEHGMKSKDSHHGLNMTYHVLQLLMEQSIAIQSVFKIKE